MEEIIKENLRKLEARESIKILYACESGSRAWGFPSKDSDYREAGHELDRVQRGLDPTDWKPMKSVGPGVREIRIQQEGQYRVIYVATFKDRVYVLHAFQKKTQKTGKQDLEAAKRALKEVTERQTS